MKKLNELINDSFNKMKSISTEHPTLTNIWDNIEDCDLEELRTVGDSFPRASKIYLSEPRSKMCVQISLNYLDCNFTVWCYTKKLKVVQHLVVDDVVENV